jgi:L-threonylcarbamoyladenylate synthase
MIVPADETGIAEAARILRSGGLAAFPTETVYGLGADATNFRGEGPAAL